MVRTKELRQSTSSLHDAKVALVEEKSSKPPGHPKFSRRPSTVHVQEESQESINERLSAPNICKQMLMDGYVQSYVDFYHLTHRHEDKQEIDGAEKPLDPAISAITPVIVAKINSDDLVFMRDNLVGAEVARRQGDTNSVYTSYNNLADHYVNKKDWKTGFFFHEKCLEVAQLTNDIRAEMSAHHSLGIINQLMRNYDRARIHHEKHESLATSVDIFEEVSRANSELYKVYSILAEKFETAGSIDEALDMYNKCNEAAKKSWDKSAEAEANGRIGSLLLNRGQIQESIPHLKLQSQLAADLGNPEARCRACSALALAYELLGQQDKALTELQLVHTVSEQSGDSYLQAQACRALGTLYSKVGRLEAAVDILQRHFTLLKGLLQKANSAQQGGNAAKSVDPTRKITSTDLDIARAFIGISKGNQLLGTYVMAIDFDFSALLDWKLNRTDLQRQQKEREQQRKATTTTTGSSPVSPRKEEEDKGAAAAEEGAAEEGEGKDDGVQLGEESSVEG